MKNKRNLLCLMIAATVVGSHAIPVFAEETAPATTHKEDTVSEDDNMNEEDESMVSDEGMKHEDGMMKGDEHTHNDN